MHCIACLRVVFTLQQYLAKEPFFLTLNYGNKTLTRFMVHLNLNVIFSKLSSIDVLVYPQKSYFLNNGCNSQPCLVDWIFIHTVHQE